MSDGGGGRGGGGRGGGGRGGGGRGGGGGALILGDWSAQGHAGIIQFSAVQYDDTADIF